MRRRPQPNPRRGIVRAAVTVVMLTILLVIAILVVSSLTAPSAKAPTTPPTPGPATTSPTGTVTTSRSPTPTAAATPSPTARKKVIGLGPDSSHGPAYMERSSAAAFAGSNAPQAGGSIRVSAGGLVTSFGPSEHVPTTAPLYVGSVGAGARHFVGMADPYVTPVWSADAGRLLYVSVAATRAQPGTRWTLHEYDLAAHRSTTLVGSTSMALFPLGWWKSQPLYAVADGTDTSLYTFSAGRAHFVSILQTQIVTSAGLSPSGRYIAMAVPTDCYRCSLDIFDLVHLKLWNGPTGMSDETQFAWSRAPEAVVTALSGTLAVVNPASHVVERFPPAGALPARWSDSMAATISGGRVMLVDTVTGRSYESGRRISR